MNTDDFFLRLEPAVALPSPLRGGVGGGGRAAPAVPTEPPPPSVPPLRGEGGADGARSENLSDSRPPW